MYTTTQNEERADMDKQAYAAAQLHCSWKEAGRFTRVSESTLRGRAERHMRRLGLDHPFRLAMEFPSDGSPDDGLVDTKIRLSPENYAKVVEKSESERLAPAVWARELIKTNFDDGARGVDHSAIPNNHAKLVAESGKESLAPAEWILECVIKPAINAEGESP